MSTTVGATAASQEDWNSVPLLDGCLITTGPQLREAKATTDLGNLVHAAPGAILQPASADDIAAMLAWCHTHRVPWRARGTRHTMHGQGLPPEGGLQIDMRSLNAVHSVSRDGGIVADAGATLRDLVTAAANHGLMLAAGPTGYTRLTIGGVCSAGGISNRPDVGALIDTVLALHVITPTGTPVWCSRTVESDLFHSVLGGFGGAGVITQVTLDVVEVPPHVRTWQLVYGPDTLPQMLADLRTLAGRAEADEVYVLWHQPELHTYRLTVSTYYPNPQDPPQASHILRDVSRPIPEPHEHVDADLLTHLTKIDELYDAATANGWNDANKVWFDAFVPDRGLDSLVTSLLPNLDDREFSSTSFGLIFPKKRAAFTTGQLLMPEADTPGDEHELVFLVDLLKDDFGLDDPQWTKDMIERHHEHLTLARDCDATIYRIGTTTTTT